MFLYEFTWIFNWNVNQNTYYHLIKSIVYAISAIPCFFVLLGIVGGLFTISLSFLHMIVWVTQNRKSERVIDHLLQPILT